uniref:Uncharacterized protein n=1 Tax=Plectus sambesii TaxID=2011161 RepID=A0A914UZL9_9BILA
MWLLTATLGNFFLMLLQAGEASKAPITDQQRLVNTIFENYDKALRPVENTMTATNVTLNPGLFSIVDTDEASESIVIAQTFRMMWKDFFLSWNPNEYGGMKQLLIPLSLIWHPDIFVINLIEIEITLPEEKNYASINYDGSVLVTVPEIVTFHCKYHINMFPFDVQNCTMRFTSWMYTAEQMDLFHLTQTDLDMYTNSTEWDFISFLPRKEKVFHGVTENSWVYINYDLIIQRKPTYYLLTFVLPCVIITTISIIGIFAPFNDSGDREEKVTMGLTTMLTMAVIFTVITDQMPKTSEGMPLLGNEKRPEIK